jgi:hypothetical protein
MCHEIETNNSTGKIKSYCELAGNIMKKTDIKHDKEKAEIPSTSYIYATKSSAFPGLVKIGKTWDVAHRVSGLNTSCAPAPHVLVAVAQTFNKDRDEKMAHAFFSEARREGEFFEIGEEDVIAYFAHRGPVQCRAFSTHFQASRTWQMRMSSMEKTMITAFVGNSSYFLSWKSVSLALFGRSRESELKQDSCYRVVRRVGIHRKRC